MSPIEKIARALYWEYCKYDVTAPAWPALSDFKQAQWVRVAHRAHQAGARIP